MIHLPPKPTAESDDLWIDETPVTPEDERLNREGDLNPYHPFWFASSHAQDFHNLDLSEVY